MRLLRLLVSAFRYVFHGDDVVDAATLSRIRRADTLARSAREQEEMPRGRREVAPASSASEGTSIYTKPYTKDAR